MRFNKLTTKQLFEIAGVDTTMGKAKAILESIPRGLPVWSNEGEQIVFITNLDPTMSQEDFFELLNKSLSPEASEIAADIPNEGIIVTKKELTHFRGIDTMKCTFQQYVENLNMLGHGE